MQMVDASSRRLKRSVWRPLRLCAHLLILTYVRPSMSSPAPSPLGLLQPGWGSHTIFGGFGCVHEIDGRCTRKYCWLNAWEGVTYRWVSLLYVSSTQPQQDCSAQPLYLYDHSKQSRIPLASTPSTIALIPQHTRYPSFNWANPMIFMHISLPSSVWTINSDCLCRQNISHSFPVTSGRQLVSAYRQVLSVELF
jgi:hypothetical protein